jgi:broad specificity phosphatase PhoE
MRVRLIVFRHSERVDKPDSPQMLLRDKQEQVANEHRRWDCALTLHASADDTAAGRGARSFVRAALIALGVRGSADAAAASVSPTFNISRIETSPFLRCVQTTRLLASELGLALTARNLRVNLLCAESAYWMKSTQNDAELCAHPDQYFWTSPGGAMLAGDVDDDAVAQARETFLRQRLHVHAGMAPTEAAIVAGRVKGARRMASGDEDEDAATRRFEASMDELVIRVARERCARRDAKASGVAVADSEADDEGDVVMVTHAQIITAALEKFRGSSSASNYCASLVLTATLAIPAALPSSSESLVADPVIVEWRLDAHAHIEDLEVPNRVVKQCM